MHQYKNNRKLSLSSYSKYKCQYKNKPILTKLSNDSGYPQDILAPSQCQSPNQNYIQQNKKNLKNFFQERIPPENTLLNRLMKRESELINPKKMFEMKQTQHELKNKTKMNLKKEFEDQIKHLKKYSFEKVNSSFHVNDKNKELREKYGGKINLSYYEEHNYRKGTHSHINKRSKIMKKQAYDKVFGPDISSLSRTAIFSKTELFKNTPPRAKSISIKNYNSLQNPDDRKNIKDLISKLKQYKNKLDDQGDDLMLSRFEQAEDFESKDEEQNLIVMIKNMTNLYKKKNVDEGYRKIQKLEDLGKLNQAFYEEMLSHKNNRLNKRMQMINTTIDINPREKRQTIHLNNSRIQLDGESILSFNEFEEPQDDFPQQSISGPIHSVQNRFKLLKKTLVRWAALFYIYGIKKNNIYIAFQPSKQAYHLQGSYVFFKCIKLGDYDSVKNFITKNYHYLYEVEFHGKSPLSYACVNNQLQIARLFLEEGVNSDKLCNNKKTSLFYALQTRNVELIQLVLQKGASPWSTEWNPYAAMINIGKNVEQISNLFNNARKIYLGMQIQPKIHQRKQFWSRYKAQIRWDFRIDYTFFSS